MNLSDRPALDQVLLNDWQHDFPLSRQPFAEIAQATGCDEATVLATYQRLIADGTISRIGGVWGAGAGGAAMLCALSIPPAQLQDVAQHVNAIAGVNHNYEREHRYNLWFVITGADRDSIHHEVDALDHLTGLRTLRLPMVRPYRIDLGFDLRQTALPAHPGERQAVRASRSATRRVQTHETALAALVEEGLPLVSRPYDAWADSLGWAPDRVQAVIQRWVAQGTLRRMGVVVRHHDLGISANAMTVLNVPDAEVDAAGARLAQQAGVTLCYRRERDADWSYNLYFMVHGHSREAVEHTIRQALAQADLTQHARETLFSGQRFKQTGGRYFRSQMPESRKDARHAQVA